MAKVRIENVDGNSNDVDREQEREDRTALSADEKKLPQDQQDRIVAEREAKFDAEQRKKVGDLLAIQVTELQYNAHTGGDQPKPVDYKTLDVGQSIDIDLTDKKSISVSFV